MKERINVTAPYVPSFEKYEHYAKQAFDRRYLTNEGPLLNELTARLKEKLQVKHVLLVNNGTTALQLAYKIKNLAQKKVLTTPYTFAATCTSLDWEKADIQFADIDRHTWNICTNSIAGKMSRQSIDAIVPVNLFGLPCELDKIDTLAKQYNVPVIYDSAHALFSRYKGKSVFQYGDIHCVSLHATKLFHTTEGGLMTFRHEEDYELAKQLINFGITDNQDIHCAGINGKMSELHAAMGLAILDDIEKVIKERQDIVALYSQQLCDYVELQAASYEHYTQPIYMPIKFKSVEDLRNAEKSLINDNIFPRRYFMPNHLTFIQNINNIDEVNNASNIAQMTLCLPLMNGLMKKDVLRITNIIKGAI